MDFCGFSFNGYHSSELGFIRVSDGDRYNDNLGPEFQDKTIQIPGGDGTYFFESLDIKKPFTINIAFDNMSETQLRTLRQVFNGKDVGPLIFDECPYKAYIVKLQSALQLKYICFEESELIALRPATEDDYNYSSGGRTRYFKPDFNYYENIGSLSCAHYVPAPDEPVDEHIYYIQIDYHMPLIHNHDLDIHNNTVRPPITFYSKRRIYKGEGTIQFIAYEPYAHSVHRYLDEFKDDPIAMSNIYEWKESSGMLQTADTDTEPDGTQFLVFVYNKGDLPVGFKLYLKFSEIQSNPIFTLSSSDGSQLNFDFSNISDTDIRMTDSSVKYICINTKSELIEGCNSLYNSVGYLYNDAIVSGTFFKIPTDYGRTLLSTGTPDIKMYHIDYDYLYY